VHHREQVFASASYRTHGDISCTEAVFKENQQQRSWLQKHFTGDTNMETL
jgi:hypothetical protein